VVVVVDGKQIEIDVAVEQSLCHGQDEKDAATAALFLAMVEQNR
jgi:hypothetical protein